MARCGSGSGARQCKHPAADEKNTIKRKEIIFGLNP